MSCSADRAGRAVDQALLHDEPAVGQPVPARRLPLRRRDLRRGVPGAAVATRSTPSTAAALIVAGDQKQLPPTCFFDSAVDDDARRVGRGGARSTSSPCSTCQAPAPSATLPLRWHYRSRHEHLITFSNRPSTTDSWSRSPSRTDEADDVGVALPQASTACTTAGARATTRSRPTPSPSAWSHHFDTRPGAHSRRGRALSEAQARRSRRPSTQVR